MQNYLSAVKNGSRREIPTIKKSSNIFKSKYFKIVVSDEKFAYAMQYQSDKAVKIGSISGSPLPSIYETDDVDFTAWEPCSQMDFGKAFSDAMAKTIYFITIRTND